MTRDFLAGKDRGDLTETAELLVSEIVTNALVHAGTPIEVALTSVQGGLRVEVTDGSPHAPTPRAYGASAGTGRGLTLLQELADEWGVDANGRGKTVWFAIACNGRLTDSDAGSVQIASASRKTVDISLLNVPLLLHEAWRQHTESLLREYLLASLDSDSADLAIAVHAEASDAIAVLEEQIPPSGVNEDAEYLMLAATEPLVSRPQVVLTVPVASVTHFATLDRAIEMALGLIETGAFLTPPSQPELQGLRTWLCGEVVEQSRGAHPSPWRPQDEPPKQIVHSFDWDARQVSASATALIAADDADRIVAVSRSALALLGYESAAELLGTRLVSIIPERYRQAHLAGFTMHFLTGRSPLIGRTVAVPALRRDGSEVQVELTITPERTMDSRTVFVANLAETKSETA